ncbi:hypothetical protein D3C72_1077420 [compost metagenome]
MDGGNTTVRLNVASAVSQHLITFEFRLVRRIRLFGTIPVGAGLLANAVCLPYQCRLTRPLREQARSHKVQRYCGHLHLYKEHHRHERRHPHANPPAGRHLALGHRRRLHRHDDRLHQLPGADVPGRASGGPEQRADFFVDLGDLHRHGGVLHRPVPALSHADHHCLVDPRRRAADHQPGRRELRRSHWCLYYLRGAGDDLRADRQLRTTGEKDSGIPGRRPAGGDPVQDRQRDFRRSATPHCPGTGDVRHLSGGQAPVAALCGVGGIADRHGIVRVHGVTGLQRLPPGSGHAGLDHTAFLPGRDHQHRHPAVCRRHDLTKHARHRRIARRWLHGTRLAADHHHRHRQFTVGTVRFPRDQPGGDQRSDLHRAPRP